MVQNYQNALMHIPKKSCYQVYELEQGPLGTIGQYWLFQNLILKLIQYPTIENQLHSSTLCK